MIDMKVCPKCGISQSDKRTVCVDCGARLEEPVSKEIEVELRAQREQKLEKLYNKGDPLYVSLFDKIMGCIMAAEFIAMLVLAIVFGRQLGEERSLIWGLIFPLIGMAEAFFPNISWSLEKLRMSFSANGTDDLTPSDFYLIMRKVGHVLLVLLGGLILFALINTAVNPPVGISDIENAESLIASMMQ